MKSAIIDCHTHNLDSTDGIIAIEPDFSDFGVGKVYSVGIHPWSSQGVSKNDLEALDALAVNPQVVAIGETGLDRLRGSSLDKQLELFRHHAALAESTGKPLIIHCVRCASEILAEYKRIRPSVPWIYHGFRGGEQLAAQLSGAGLYLSFGPKFNHDALKCVEHRKILMETDDSGMTIAQVEDILPQGIGAIAADNLARILRQV